MMFPSGSYCIRSEFPRSARTIMTRKYVDGIRRTGFIKDTMKLFEKSWTTYVLKKIILKNEDTFVKESFNLPDPVVNIIKCRTPAYMQVIVGLIDDDVLQMLNAGNIQGAIERTGFSVESHDNIIESVTASYERKLINNKNELEYVKRIVCSNRSEEESQQNRISSISEIIQSTQNKIDSIKERLNSYQDGVCSICFDEHTNPAAVKCCQNIFCLQCITMCLKSKNTCPMCRSSISLNNLSVIKTPSIQSRQSNALPNKEDALFELLTVYSHGKFLIFSSHDQSFVYIENSLKSTGNEVVKLMGSSSRVSNILSRFKTGDLNVLMLNSTHYGTGLNLENTTDLVFYHKMPSDMEKQVIGRAQRAGRSCPLRIHYLYQENEI